jgi:hypothetical protein
VGLVTVWLFFVKNVNILWVGCFGVWVLFEMEISFIVESKTFVFSVLDGVLTLRVGEKRKASPAKFSLVLRVLSGWLRRWRISWVIRKIKSSSNLSGKDRES